MPDLTATWQEVVLGTLIVVAIALALARLVRILRDRFFPPRCPKCGNRGPSTIDFKRAYAPQGGDWWYLFNCRLCGLNLKYFRDKGWADGWPPPSGDVKTGRPGSGGDSETA